MWKFAAGRFSARKIFLLLAVLAFALAACTPAAATPTGTFNIGTGLWETGGSANATWSDPVLTVGNGANIIVTGTSTGRRIVVNGAADITLNNVSITGLGSWQSPLLLNSGANLTLTLEGTSTLTANTAGIQVSTGRTLTIGGTGTVNATGGSGAGIGGTVLMPGGSNTYSPGGNIIINSGTVNAIGGGNSAGIGGGGQGEGGNITINGGTVNAIGIGGGAGIGGGDTRAGGTTNISGNAIVNATGNGGGAGIGGGSNGAGGNITISGGTVVANGGNTFGGAGIGGGARNDTTGGAGGNITISGGNVTANGGTGTASFSNQPGAGIGGGASNWPGGSVGNGGSITISGGSVNANSGGPGAPHIGGGDGALFLVAYNANGGTGTMASALVAPGGSHTIAANAFTAPSSQIFTGWNTAASGSGTAYAAGATITSVSANITLFAQWAPVPAPITGGVVTVTAPVRDALVANATASLTSTTAGPITWTHPGGAAGLTFGPARAYTGVFTLTASAGFNFNGLLANALTVPGATVTHPGVITGNSVTLTVTFPPTAAANGGAVAFPITIQGGGTGSGATPNPAMPGDTVTVNAGLRDGYVFAGWTSAPGVTFVNAANVTTAFVMPNQAVAVTANWNNLSGSDYDYGYYESEGEGRRRRWYRRHGCDAGFGMGALVLVMAFVLRRRG